jgi:hypothetical protein
MCYEFLTEIDELLIFVVFFAGKGSKQVLLREGLGEMTQGKP